MDHWASPNHAATDQSGFTGRPGGRRLVGFPNFSRITLNAYFWSSIPFDAGNGRSNVLNKDNGNISLGGAFNKKEGHSVRCIAN